MKKRSMILLAAMLLVASMGASLAEQASAQIDVTGFWYIEDGDDSGLGIELQEDGVAILTNEEGDITAEGTFVAEGANVTIMAGGIQTMGVVDGDTMSINGGQQTYMRDGIEVGYWINDLDDSAIELYEGSVWMYDAEGDVLGEGTYTVDGNTVSIEMEGKAMIGEIAGGVMKVDGVAYNLL